MCQSLFFNKVAKEALTQMFSCEFYEISEKTFLHTTPLVSASGSSKNVTLNLLEGPSFDSSIVESGQLAFNYCFNFLYLYQIL